MKDELARLRDLASRCHARGRQALDPAVRATLLEVARDYERQIAEIEERDESK